MNYTPPTTLLLTLCVVAILSLVSLLDPSSLGFSWLRRADIYSSLRPQGDVDMFAQQQDDQKQATTIFTRSRSTLADSSKRDTLLNADRDTSAGMISLSDSLSGATTVAAIDRKVDTIQIPDHITPLEDFSADGLSMDRFYEKLTAARTAARPVRIAFFGDSFIEGDLFTQDLREMLQDRFGGNGVGFVPITSTVSMFRQSVGHTFSGWSTYDIAHNGSKGGYPVSSYIYIPSPDETSTVAYKSTTYRRFLNHFSVARLFFVSPAGAKIDAVINDTARRSFTCDAMDKMSYVSITLDTIRSVRFKVRAGEGFRAYGSSLEGRSGVSVDNYSLRGNSGASLMSIDSEVTTQMSKLYPVDMIVLQYGLNMLQNDMMNYSGYMKQLREVIARLNQLFPDVAIVVMGVSDCSTRSSGEWATKPSALALASAQRKMARGVGVAHWSTMGAMRKLGGMPQFVEYGWAAKDYTHLSAKGGRKVARALFEAMIFDMKNRGFID